MSWLLDSMYTSRKLNRIIQSKASGTKSYKMTKDSKRNLSPGFEPRTSYSQVRWSNWMSYDRKYLDFTFLPILIRFIRSRRLFFPSLGALPVPSGTGSLSLSIIGLVCSSSDIVKIQRMKTSQRSNCTAASVLQEIRIYASFSPEFSFLLPLFNGNCQTLFTDIECSQETKVSHHLNLNSNL